MATTLLRTSEQDATDRLAAIDGLRAIAILLVVLFHTVPAAARGGFVGVDIFFVVSGFVIGLRYLDGWPGARPFFERRIERLLPAATVAITLTTTAAVFLLAPKDLYNFGRSLAAQALYLQNLSFWYEGDYFEPGLVKPLLHTWSLAIEEQAYLLFPLLALAYRRRWGNALLGAAILASVAAGLTLGMDSPKTSYFLLPARLWEFGVGILASRAFKSVRPSTTASWVGITAISFAAFVFDHATLHPGSQALMAVAGTVLLCLFHADRGVLAALQPFGLMSYSWYLWHWPVLAFFFVMAGRTPGPEEALACAAIGFALGWASWRWVEPVRLRSPYKALALFSGTCLLVGGGLMATGGGLVRYPVDQRALLAAPLDRVPPRCRYMERLRALGSAMCVANRGGEGGVLLVGDSHAQRATTVLASLGREYDRPVFVAKASCAPNDCDAASMATLRKEAKAAGVTDIVMVAYWRPDMTVAEYRYAVRSFRSFRVHLAKALPSSTYFDPVARAAGSRVIPYNRADYDASRIMPDAHFGMVGANILDTPAKVCPEACKFAVDGKPLYVDTNHLTTAGVETLRPMFRQVFVAN